MSIPLKSPGAALTNGRLLAIHVAMQRFILLAFFLIALPIAWLRLMRPQTAVTQQLYPGVTYQRLIQPDAVIHVVAIDRTVADVDFLVTPPAADGRYAPRTTPAFLRQYDLQLAINGSFYQNNLATEAPEPLGLTISDGTTAVASRDRYPALCVSQTAVLHIDPSGHCFDDTQQAIAGNVLLVDSGVPLDPRQDRFPGRANAFRPQPRTAVGFTNDQSKVWLVVVDGRQPGYSQGLTLAETAQLLADLGAHMALNLDGGGSSTLAAASWYGAKTLNSPVHNGVPTLARPVPTHLGIYVQP